MKLIKSLEDFNDVFAIVEYPEEYVGVGNNTLIEKTSHYSSKLTDDTITRYFMEGVHISMISKNGKETFGYHVRTDSPYLQMHFELEGSVFYKSKEYGGMDCLIPSGFHTLFYYPALYGQLQYPVVRQGFAVEIEITINFLKRIFNDDLSALGLLEKNIEHERPFMVGGKCFPITVKMREILMEMYHCSYIGPLKKIYIEGKLLELLTIQLAQLTLDNQTGISTKWSKRDVERLHEAQSIIEKNISDPCSIDELSKLVGVNRTKLQKDFKDYFGTTIFGYIADVRMDKAQQMILHERDMKIAEIAYKIGYKNANHFSTAYKKRFHINPQDTRKGKP